MQNAIERSNLKMYVALLEFVRDLQERLDDVTLMTYAMSETLARQDEGFADRYLAKKDEMQNGEIGQRAAANLASLNELISTMNAELA